MMDEGGRRHGGSSSSSSDWSSDATSDSEEEGDSLHYSNTTNSMATSDDDEEGSFRSDLDEEIKSNPEKYSRKKGGEGDSEGENASSEEEEKEARNPFSYQVDDGIKLRAYMQFDSADENNENEESKNAKGSMYYQPQQSSDIYSEFASSTIPQGSGGLYYQDETGKKKRRRTKRGSTRTKRKQEEEREKEKEKEKEKDPSEQEKEKETEKKEEPKGEEDDALFQELAKVYVQKLTAERVAKEKEEQDRKEERKQEKGKEKETQGKGKEKEKTKRPSLEILRKSRVHRRDRNSAEKEIENVRRRSQEEGRPTTTTTTTTTRTTRRMTQTGGNVVVESNRIHLPKDLTARSWNSSFQKLYRVLGVVSVNDAGECITQEDASTAAAAVTTTATVTTEKGESETSTDVEETMRVLEAKIADSLAGIASLYQDFLRTAELYTRLIVNERFLPNNQKTLPPCDLGGIAGGNKYMAEGIVFKFNIDAGNIYGGISNAVKAAGHELKGFNALQALGIPGLYFPLFVLIDYRGFRVSATTVLPIAKNTLKIGSWDGGVTVFNSDRKLDSLLTVAADLLGLKPHLAGAKKNSLQTIPLALDVEGHLGTDGRYYVIDTSRLMPPERPIQAGSFLYRLLRPEFIRVYPVPLCADAYSMFIRHDPQKEIHNKEVTEGTLYLLQEEIPKFAEWLDSKQSLPDSSTLTTLTHARGINVRFYGLLLECVRSPYWRSVIITEIVFRAAKATIRVLMRRAMEMVKLPTEEPYKRALVQYLNLLLGNTPEAEEYRSHELISTIKDCSFSHHRMNLDWTGKEEHNQPIRFGLNEEIKERLDRKALLEAIVTRMGIVLKKPISNRRLHFTKPIKNADIVALEPTHKLLEITELARVFMLSQQFFADWATEKGQAKAVKVFKAVTRLSDDSWLLVYYASIAIFECWKQVLFCEVHPLLREQYLPANLASTWWLKDILGVLSLVDRPYLLRGVRTQHPHFHNVCIRWARDCATLSFQKMLDCLIAFICLCHKLQDFENLKNRIPLMESLVGNFPHLPPKFNSVGGVGGGVPTTPVGGKEEEEDGRKKVMHFLRELCEEASGIEKAEDWFLANRYIVEEVTPRKKK